MLHAPCCSQGQGWGRLVGEVAMGGGVEGGQGAGGEKSKGHAPLPLLSLSLFSLLLLSLPQQLGTGVQITTTL